MRPGIVFKSGLLCKTDLTTELVKEFTELQGIIGGLYARVQELDPLMPETSHEAIADAIYDQYKPESMDDSVPRSIEGECSPLLTRPTASPACSRWACSRQARKTHLHCAARRTAS